MAGGIVLVMGLPATGKTTLCKYLAKNDRTKVWSLDEYPDAETLRAKNDIIFQSVFNSLQEDPDTIHIIDDTLHLKSMRRRYVILAKEQRIGLAIVHLDAPLEVILQRNSCRTGRIDDSTILKMVNSFEPVCPSHHCYLVSITSEDLWTAISDKLVWSQKHHCEIAETSQIGEVESQNRTHKLSLLLNQAVSSIIQETSPIDRKTTAMHLIPLKQKMFVDLKSLIQEDDKLRTAIDEDNRSYFQSLLQDHIIMKEQW